MFPPHPHPSTPIQQISVATRKALLSLRNIIQQIYNNRPKRASPEPTSLRAGTLRPISSINEDRSRRVFRRTRTRRVLLRRLGGGRPFFNFDTVGFVDMTEDVKPRS